MNRFDKIEFDKKSKEVILTKHERLKIEAQNMDELEKQLKDRLRVIVRQVKKLKNEAENIKELLTEIKTKKSRAY